jgi:hypothetical protein
VGKGSLPDSLHLDPMNGLPTCAPSPFHPFMDDTCYRAKRLFVCLLLFIIWECLSLARTWGFDQQANDFFHPTS